MEKKISLPKIQKANGSERITVERYKGNYTTVYNDGFYNKKLSWKATGLLYTMLSLHPDWDYTIAGLATLKKDGIDSTRAAIKELEKYGYIERFRCKDNNGLYSKNFYKVYECPAEQNPNYASIVNNLNKSSYPSLEKPSLENPTMEKPTLENPMQLNTKEKNTNGVNTQSINQSNNSDSFAVGNIPAKP